MLIIISGIFRNSSTPAPGVSLYPATGRKLQTTAFANKDGSIVVVVMNTTDKKMPYHLIMKGVAAVTESLPHSISNAHH